MWMSTHDQPLAHLLSRMYMSTLWPSRCEVRPQLTSTLRPLSPLTAMMEH